jgi:Exocyst complex component Sec10
VHSVLVGHMQRYTYSATGALRWKRDVTEYADWARSLRAPLLDDRFQELQVPGRQHAQWQLLLCSLQMWPMHVRRVHHYALCLERFDDVSKV